jgi:hypothetical protein
MMGERMRNDKQGILRTLSVSLMRMRLEMPWYAPSLEKRKTTEVPTTTEAASNPPLEDCWCRRGNNK